MPSLPSPPGPETDRGARALVALGLLVFGFLVAPVAWTVGDPLHEAVSPRLAGLLLAFLPYAWAVWAARRAPEGARAYVVVVALAVVMRLALLGATPTFSDDVYRYAWDGRVQLAGVNPYAHPPDAEALRGLRDEAVWSHVNYREIRTIYPPVAQAAFAISGLFGNGILPLKVLVVLFDLGTLLVLGALLRRRRRPAHWAVVYAWNPLVVVEFSLNGHVDSLGIFFLMVALHLASGPDRIGAALALALSAGAKLFAIAVWPFVLLRRRGAWIFPFLLAALYLPYASAGPHLVEGLSEYGDRWETNPGGFAVVRAVVRASGLVTAPEEWRRRKEVDRAARGAVIGLFAALALRLLQRRTGPTEAAYLLVGAFLLLSPTVHPWYATWIVPFLAIRLSRAWLLFTATVPLVYLALPDWLDPQVRQWEDHPIVWVCIWGPLVTLLAVDAWRARAGRGNVSAPI